MCRLTPCRGCRECQGSVDGDLDTLDALTVSTCRVCRVSKCRSVELVSVHPREVLVATILVGAQHAAHLLSVDLVEDVEVLLGCAAVSQLRRLASVGVARQDLAHLPAEGFFLAPPPASRRVLFLMHGFLNAAPRL